MHEGPCGDGRPSASPEVHARRGKSLTGSKPRQGMLRQSAKQKVIAKLTYIGNASERGETQRAEEVIAEQKLLPRATSPDDLHSEKDGDKKRAERPGLFRGVQMQRKPHGNSGARSTTERIRHDMTSCGENS